ncbi:MAG TPA: hypothetical protein VMW74_03465 [Nitrosopumilaceae archaeon]|nr:hypothetical protein [Nitrosopumilaceae archaeon]
MKFEKITVIIFLIGVSIMLLPSTSGYLIPTTHLDLYLDNDLIVLGQVLSLEDFKDDSNTTPRTSYEILILQQIKGNTETNKITVIGLGSLNSTIQIEEQTILYEGQKSLLMLNELMDGNWYISPYSISFEDYNPDSQFILSPLKLYKAGIPIEEIHCKSNLEIAIKSSNGSPVCLKPETKDTLYNRGWTK